jgi:hypothetical protein
VSISSILLILCMSCSKLSYAPRCLTTLRASHVQSCPVYVIHGSHDAIVPFYHGQTLFQSLPHTSKVVPFWARGAGHNNIEMDMPTAYIKRLQQFIRQCDRLNYPKSSSSRSSRSEFLNASSSSSGGSVEEQLRQTKKVSMHLTSQASKTQSMSSWLIHQGDVTNTTQTSKQRKQKGTLVMRPFHNQVRAPPPPPRNKLWLNQNQSSVGHHIVEPGVGTWNDNNTTLVLTNNGVHSTPVMMSTTTTTIPHSSSLAPFSFDSSVTATAMSSPTLSAIQRQQQQTIIGNHSYIPTTKPVMYSKNQPMQTQQQPQHEIYRLLNQQEQHVQRSPYRTLNSL